MADDIGVAQVIGQTNVSGYISGVVQAVWILMGLVIVGLVLWLIIRKLQFKYPTLIKDVTGNNPITHITKSREYWTKEGIRVWQNELFKESMGIPPSNAFDIASKGKKMVVVWRVAPKEYIFQTPDKLVEKKDKKDISYYVEKGEFLNMPQRAVLVDQQMKANDHLQKGMATIIRDAVPYLALVIIIGMVVFGWGELVAPFSDAQTRVIAYTTAQNEQLSLIKDIKLGVQRIGEGVPLQPAYPMPRE